MVLRATGELGEALESLKAARAIKQALADAHPAVTKFQRDLGLAHHEISILLKETGRSSEALVSLRAARAVYQRLVDSNPAVTLDQLQVANTHLETGDVIRLTGQPAEARASYEEALAIIERLIKAQPTLADTLQVYLVFGLKGLGATQQAAGQAAGAVASWRRAIASDERTRSSHNETLYSWLAATPGSVGSPAQRDRACRPPRAPPNSTRRWSCYAGRWPGVTATSPG
jgi:tetratricopeptide (TPR) repeat protein